ncbi:hypothetical protein H5410_042235 [Solanum commersonii]|uniref:Uncharacterized protein n=1 Tax=Solanum commersonii TaxID=4109 RepID=A0A9J5XU65_SOLCO|nr:hypothetical protein H5410_042235 [Solanum commersonii]
MLYERKLVHNWEGYDSDLSSYIDITNEYINILGYVGVQPLIVYVPSEKYYEIEGDEGIKALLSFVNDKFDVINLFVVDDSELDVDVENITKMLETVVVIDNVSTDCTYDGTENDSDTFNDNSNYNFEELEEKLQVNPKYKIKEMRVDLKTAFNINAHFEKCKRAKRTILEDMEGSFCDDYKKLVGVWDLIGIPCPRSIKAILYKNLDPLEEIHWWYSKETYLLTYHCKLQLVPSQKF